MSKRTLGLCIFLNLFVGLFAQEVGQPNFYLSKGKQGQVQVWWQNPSGKALVQVSVQKSLDSIKNFRTVYTSLTPEQATGHFEEPRTGIYYYRLFYMFSDGRYNISSAKLFTTGYETPNLLKNVEAFKQIFVEIPAKETRAFSLNEFKNYRDSILFFTEDSLLYMGGQTLRLSPFVKSIPERMAKKILSGSPVYPPSYTYINEEGNPVLRLPSHDYYNYSLKIWSRDQKTVMFTVKSFDSPELVLSNASFSFQGDYPYELYYLGDLKEKNKIEIR